MLLNRDSAIRSASRRFCTVYQSENSVPCQPSSRHDIRPDDENFQSWPSAVSRSFELFQLASIRTFQQHVRTTLSVRPSTRFLSKTQIWEVRCNRPDDVESRPNALIHKASITFKIQTSRRQSSWSELECIRSTVWTHEALIWKLLAAEVRPSERQGTPSAWGSNQERISAKFWKADRTVEILGKIKKIKIGTCSIECVSRSSKNILCKFQVKEAGSQASVWTVQYNVWMLISQQHQFGRCGNTVQIPISVQKFRTIQAYIFLEISEHILISLCDQLPENFDEILSCFRSASGRWWLVVRTVALPLQVIPI
jgi:hypothetical protein